MGKLLSTESKSHRNYNQMINICIKEIIFENAICEMLVNLSWRKGIDEMLSDQYTYYLTGSSLATVKILKQLFSDNRAYHLAATDGTTFLVPSHVVKSLSFEYRAPIDTM